jgi:hypothetical protein
MQLVFFEFFICSIIFLDFGVSEESFSLYSVGKTHVTGNSKKGCIGFYEKKTPLIYYYYICGAFTIDSSTPTLRRNLNEHSISIDSFHHKKDIFGRKFLKSF